MTRPADFTSRVATLADAPAIATLIDRAIAELQRSFLTPAELEASRSFMGLDTQLIEDGTFLLLLQGTRIVGCGGWSARATLYGGSAHAGLRDATKLDPVRDPARIRAMYTDPDFARRGVGRRILALCEAEASRAGFARAELMSTLAGEPLYRACGYAPLERILSAPADGVSVRLIRMGKRLATGAFDPIRP